MLRLGLVKRRALITHEAAARTVLGLQPSSAPEPPVDAQHRPGAPAIASSVAAEEEAKDGSAAAKATVSDARVVDLQSLKDAVSKCKTVESVLQQCGITLPAIGGPEHASVKVEVKDGPDVQKVSITPSPGFADLETLSKLESELTVLGSGADWEPDSLADADKMEANLKQEEKKFQEKLQSVTQLYMALKQSVSHVKSTEQSPDLSGCFQAVSVSTDIGYLN